MPNLWGIFHIKYKIMSKIIEGYLQFEQKLFIDYDEMLKDDLWEDLWEDFTKEQLHKLFSKSIETDNTTFKYYFNHETIRIINANSDNMLFLYDFQQLIGKSFYMNDQGQMKYSSIDWNSKRINNDTWKVSYSYEIDKTDRKMILGFDCFKSIVKQKRIFHEETDIKIFELYVTDEIILPAHAILMWWDLVIPYCALEIIEYDEGKKQQSYIEKNIQVVLSQNVDSYLQIPDEFKKLIL